MRERRPEDWLVDLGGRHDLEGTVAAALAAHPGFALLRTSTAAMDRLDFQLVGPGDRLCELELKAKRQPYRGWSDEWPAVPEEDLFILDELALRRLLQAGRYAFLLVRDYPANRWCLWSTFELAMTSKVRVGRRLAGPHPTTKGKLLIDLASSAATATTLPGALSHVASMVGLIDRRWGQIHPWPWQETVRAATTKGGRRTDEVLHAG